VWLEWCKKFCFTNSGMRREGNTNSYLHNNFKSDITAYMKIGQARAQ